MAMLFTITKAQYDKLAPEFQGEYIAGDKDGEYRLDVSGLPAPEDVGPIKRALEAERGKLKALKTENEELKTQVAEFPDIEKIKADHGKEVGKYKSFTERTLVDNTALALATKISTSPSLILPHIKARLLADVTGDEPVTKVLGPDGKPSDLTLEKLGQEFVANKDFAAIIVGSRASGGGAPRAPVNPGGGGAPIGELPTKDANLATVHPKDLVARIAAKKAAEAGQAQ